MENKKQRVLAYTMAKELKHDELKDVSGGSSSWCTRITGGMAQVSGQGHQSILDVVIDH